MSAPYEVWVRSISSMTTKFRVNSIENARLLHAKLCKIGLKCTPPIDLGDNDSVTFSALSAYRNGDGALVKIIEKWPEVKLMFDPA